MNEDLLTISLEVAVAIYIDEMRNWTPEERIEAARGCVEVVASHGDDLQYGGKFAADAFAKLACGLACLAYQPGGVTFMGTHWEASS